MTALELQELAAAGLTLDDVASGPIEIWPDNVAPYNLFAYMWTQWRVGMAGPTGLDYNVLHRKLDRMGLTAEQVDRLEEDIQIMEGAALLAMRPPDKPN
ncbi:MAG TPA: DUF1799 domain-containing protein [Telluria sp.]